MRKIKPSLFSVRSICYAALILLIILPSAMSAYLDRSPIGSAEAEKLLKAGNERFASGLHKVTEWSRERVELSNGQKPFATVLSCSDSRVPPEIVFDQSLGKVFIVRAAGNVVDPITLGSIEYGVDLYSNLLLVLGHDKCGAVDALLKNKVVDEITPNTSSKGELDNLKKLLELIKPAVEKVERENPRRPREKLLALSIAENVRLQMQQAYCQSQTLRRLINERTVRMIGGIYHFDTGRVEILSDLPIVCR